MTFSFPRGATRSFYILLSSLAIFSSVSAYEVSSWHMVRYHLPSDSEFISFSGDMVIPPLKPISEGTYYVWPGLETPNDDGIYQNVLSGNSSGENSGTWSYFSGYCCHSPTLPWGISLDLIGGDTVSFSNMKSSASWTTMSKKASNGRTVTSAFPELSQSRFFSMHTRRYYNFKQKLTALCPPRIS